MSYSLQQATNETLYVPLRDTAKYKAKAFIDMFVDRAGKALSALCLVVRVGSCVRPDGPAADGTAGAAPP